MATEIYWVCGPWSGKVGIAARPRGGDWLKDEMLNWRLVGVDTVLSVLTQDEQHELDLDCEPGEALAIGIKFLTLPITDREVPKSEDAIAKVLAKLDAELSSGKNVVIHCRQGIGRSGLVAACLLVTRGWEPQAAVLALSRARGTQIPETREQRAWIDHYAADLTATR